MISSVPLHVYTDRAEESDDAEPPEDASCGCHESLAAGCGFWQSVCTNESELLRFDHIKASRCTDVEK